jgi:hypothetical protein
VPTSLAGLRQRSIFFAAIGLSRYLLNVGNEKKPVIVCPPTKNDAAYLANVQIAAEPDMPAAGFAKGI